jgi:hypothetical protein
MLHDPVMSRAAGRFDCSQELSHQPAEIDRRASDRVPFPAEMVLAWNHDFSHRMRFRIIDAGDGGYRIHSSLPVLEGTTGMVLRILPGGVQPIDQSVMVVWCHACDDGEGFDVGLRVF